MIRVYDPKGLRIPHYAGKEVWQQADTAAGTAS